MRAIIHEADSAIIEEWKWVKPTNPGVPVFSRGGIVCTGETYKNLVKLTFAKGAELSDRCRRIVDQKRLGGGWHSTVGTVTDIYSLLRLLFSRFGQPCVGNRLAFSFNDPQGRCPECNGVGRKLGVDLDKFLDTSKSLKQGAILFPEYAIGNWAGIS